MRGKSLLAFAMAIGCGLVAMVGVQQALQKQKVDPDTDKVTVFVAAAEILPGQTIDLNMLERRKFLKESVPPEAVTDPKQLEKRALTVKAMPGDVIRLDKLGAEGKTGASISIPVGMRTVTIPTNTTQAHSGMMQPGDRVDVMVTYRVQPPSGGRDYPETKTILGNIAIFATDADRDANASAEGAKGTMKNVSLLVTPEQAQLLTMAQSFGTIVLALRNAGDTKDVEITNLTPDLFRSQIVMNNASENPKPQPQPRADSKNELDNFLDEAAGKPETTKTATAAKTTETWEIAFYRKDGVTIETLEVPRREEPAESQETKSKDQSVMGNLFNLFEGSGTKSKEEPSAVKSAPAKPAKDQGDVSAQNPSIKGKTAAPPTTKPAVTVKPPVTANAPVTAKAPVTKTSVKK